MNSTKFNDVERRVKFSTGYARALNHMAKDEFGLAKPQVNVEKVERAVRKQHAKFYGLDSKYDGKGNRRELTY